MSRTCQDIGKRTRLVRQQAHRIGFDAIGFARARRLDEEAPRLEKWLRENRHGEMAWMEKHLDKRLDPRKLVPGAKSVVSVLISYHQPHVVRRQAASKHPKIAKYALGDDYHDIFRDKLRQLYAYTEEITGKVEGRVFVDSAPVMDKAWAVASGLGWLGKNTNLINREWGSWFLLGEMILDIEFEYDLPVADHCGSCTRCIDACPTNAIYKPYKVDGSKCISYFTIELKKEIPEACQESMGDWIFGCDICQDVCPWNRKVRPGRNEQLACRAEIFDRTLAFWEELDLEEYRRLFRKSAVKRPKYHGFMRNVRIAAANIRGRGNEENAGDQETDSG